MNTLNFVRRSVVGAVVCVLAACSNDVGPTVSLAATSLNVSAAGTVTLVASADSVGSITKVEFYDGSKLLSTSTLAPYFLLISFTTNDNGAHAYTAKAYDSAGKSTVSAAVTVSVSIVAGTGGGSAGTGGGSAGTGGGSSGTGGGSSATGGGSAATGGGSAATGGGSAATGGGSAATGGGSAATGGGSAATGGGSAATGGGSAATGGGAGSDTTPPAISLTASSNTVAVAGQLTLSATATDDVGVVKVELFDGFTKVGERNLPTAGTTWAFTFNLTTADNGTHNYTARAWDAALNTTQSNLSTVNVLIPNPSGIKQIVGGNSFSYVVKNDGTLLASGGTSSGALGGNTYTTFSQPFPGYKVKRVGFTASANSALFVSNTDALFGVGSNAYGMLANPTSSTTFLVPTAASPAVDSVADIWAGEYTSCFIKQDTTAWCMGYSWLGNNINGLGSATPSQVLYSDGGVVTGVVQISSGYEVGALLKSDGTVWAWGRNDLTGSVGDGTFTNRPGVVPVTYIGGAQVSGVSRIAVARGASFAVIADGGTVVGWGSNQDGMLGDNSNAALRLNATPVYALSNIVDIVPGSTFLLAVDSQGDVWSWGSNQASQLGNPDAGSSSNKPVQVVGITGVAKVAAGRDFSFALKANGELWGWGYNLTALGINDAGTTVIVPHRIIVP